MSTHNSDSFEVSDRPVYAICFSHGHLGHNSGLPLWLEQARARRTGATHQRPRQPATPCRAVPRHHGAAGTDGRVQFRRAGGAMQGKFPAHLPGQTFTQSLMLGDTTGRHIELIWAPSETDDCIAVWCPNQRILYGGPAVIDSIPNLGTPFRTQRDVVRWADTLDRLAALRPLLLVREFGPPLVGEEQVAQIPFPPRLFDVPWMQATYGDPYWIARDV